MTKEILEAVFAAKDAGADAWEKFKKEKLPKLISDVKTYVWKIGRWFLLSFLITIPLLFAGIALEIKTLIVFAGLIRAIITVALMIILAPVLIVIEMIKDGIPGSIKRYIDSIRGLFIAELVVTAIIAWIPVKNNPDMIAMLILLLSVLSFLGSRFMSRKVAISTVSFLLVLTIASFFSPYRIQSWSKNWRDSDMETGMPQRIDQTMTCDGFKQGEYRFFGDKGEPIVYFYDNYFTREIEVYKLMSKNKTHPQTGETLLPISKKVYYDIWKRICSGEEEALKEQEKEKAELLNSYSHKYISQNFPNNPASVEIAVLVIDTSEQPAYDLTEETVSQLRSEGFNAVSNFFTPEFISDRIFYSVLESDRGTMEKMELAKHLDFVVLGIKSNSEIKLRVISLAEKGRAFEDFSADENNPDLLLEIIKLVRKKIKGGLTNSLTPPFFYFYMHTSLVSEFISFPFLKVVIFTFEQLLCSSL